ncbi:MAG: hypothetical protein A2X01_04625 [Bacteroidetes bacterium GWF2_35_48]|nr:MAG: hypothetical protein A2X01_04625 [Bacteroidetes bacterium GWF2_35_48]OFZ02744.1 MAG: hypothetical protein A2491_03355 [Bacteroidetes bacterium RIFOXYC12_FULL_35_7]
MQSQTFTLTHEIPYATYHQNMWGPNWSPFTLDFDYEFFHVQWDESYSWSEITTIFGEEFGVGFQAGTWGDIGAYFCMHGFTTGFVNVKYPVEIHLTFPDDLTFLPGETVTVNSDYDVLPDWWLDTHYPSVGTTTLWLDFGFGANIDLIICAFGCDTINVIPPINIPTDSITVFHIDSTGYVVYPSYNPNLFPPFEFIEDSVLPIIIDDWFNIGLTGEITLPYVITTDTLMPDQCLYASGDSTYLHLNLDIITFISAVAGLIPPPTGPAIQQALGYLNGSVTIPLGPSSAVITWSLITASFYLTSTQQQDFTFCPTIWCHLSFPTDLNYTETDPSQNDSLITQGTNDTIVFAVNNDLNIQYPCHDWDTMPIGIEYTMTNDFTNHTWDSIAFGFQFSALTVSVHIPTMYKAIPEVEIPDFCLPMLLDSSEYDSIPIICMQGYTAPAVVTMDTPKDFELMDIDFQIGPMFQDSFDLGYIPLTWYNNTWNLDGFTPEDTVMAPTQIVPGPELEATISGNGVICFGDSTGTIVVTAINGIPPYTFTYSNGVVNTHPSNIDNVFMTSGYYTVTITDGFGCEVDTFITIYDLNPPIILDLEQHPVLCHGESTGWIDLTVSGGVPGYTYIWQPSGQTIQDPVDLPTGLYTVTVTDNVGCPKIDSILVTEPDSAVTITDTSKNISCAGGNDGFIDITPIGGTPPYQYDWTNGLHTEDIYNLTAGTYTVSVIDNNSCVYTHTVTLTEPLPLEIDVLATDVSCYHMHDGSVDITVSGGTPPYSYLWNTGAITEDISGLASGTFRVTVTDSLGCTKIAIAFLTEPLAPLTVTYTSVDIRCHGGTNGAIDLTVFGGTSPYTYAWNNNATSQDLINLPAGDYSVTVTDAHQCDTILNIVLTQPDAPLLATAVGENVLCYGGYTGSIDLTVTGGTPQYYYLWNNGFTTQDLTGIPSGIYTVTVSDANDCIANVTLYIDQPDELFFLLSADKHICYGQSIYLSVSLATGGTQPYTFNWSNGMIGDSIQVTPLISSDYHVSINDANGCTVSPQTVHVDVDPPLTIDAFINKDTICPKDPVFIYANISGGGGAPYTVYLNDSVFGALPLSVIPDTTTTYTIWVYDRCKFDSVVDSITVYTYPLPPLNFAFDKASGCQPLTVHFNEYSPNVGQSYLWDFDDGDYENLSLEKNPVHTFYNAVEYNVQLIVTSKEGCKKDSDTANIIVFKKPDARFDIYPQGGHVTISDPLVKFYDMSADYINLIWNFGDGTTSQEKNPEHAFQNYGTYPVNLYATSDKGCLDTASAIIYVDGETSFYAPTAFTPDDDGHNEYFTVFGRGMTPGSFKLHIYDRWGEIIFQTDDISKGWNGKINNSKKLCPPGVYTWVAWFKDQYGNGMSKSGTVTLIR